MKNTDTVRIAGDPYDLGVEDYGKGITNCPYSYGSDQAKQWNKAKSDCEKREKKK